MITFIQENYQQKLELDDIARNVHLCKSECCRIFKRYMKESLFDYLLKYRIEQSLPDILAGEESLTEIALHSGFADSNYFSKVFHRLKGCSPRDYRKKIYHLNQFQKIRSGKGDTMDDNIMQFTNRTEFRAWLEKNCQTASGIWLLFGKAGGPETLTAGEALEEALCFGWIDGQMQKIDDKSYKNIFHTQGKQQVVRKE